MATRYGKHDIESVPALQSSALLDLTSTDYIMPRQDSDSSEEYSEETDTHHSLSELLEQFWQLQYQFSHLKSSTHPPTPVAMLM